MIQRKVQDPITVNYDVNVAHNHAATKLSLSPSQDQFALTAGQDGTISLVIKDKGA